MCRVFRAHCRSLWTIFLRRCSVRPIAAALSRWPSNTCLISWMSKQTRDRSLTRTYGTPGRATGEIPSTSCLWPHFLQHLWIVLKPCWDASSVPFVSECSTLSVSERLKNDVFYCDPRLTTITKMYLSFFLNQPSSAVLGQRDKKPSVCLWHPQEQYYRRLPVSGGSDLHGLLLDVWASPGQRLSVKQAPLC